MDIDITDNTNAILYYEDGEVKIKENCLSFKPVSILLNRDKSMGKKYLKKCITYCYYINHKDSPIAHKPLTIKKKDILLVKDGMLLNFDSNGPYYKNFEDWFKNNHYSILELRYKKVIEEIDELINRFTDIPLYRDINTDVFVNTTECINGESVPITKKIKIKESLDNSEEKKKAIFYIKDLESLREFLLIKLKQEYSNKIKISTSRLFDK